MTITKTLLAIAVFFFSVNAKAQVKAQDGKTYKTVKIGNQMWMAENLSVSTYRNGDSIPQVKDSVAWSKLTTGAWCYCENKTANGTKYGKLYNWYAVTDPRGLAPKGWHIPSDAEWTQLTDFLGGEKVAGNKMKNASGWKDYKGKNGNGTNESGFRGLPGGFRFNHGAFENIVGSYSYWWSSPENNTSYYNRLLTNDSSFVSRVFTLEAFGLSVRCLRDGHFSNAPPNAKP